MPGSKVLTIGILNLVFSAIASRVIAGEFKEVAVLKGTGSPATSLALSRDGSRLVVATHLPEEPSKLGPAQVVVWNVADEQQVSICTTRQRRDMPYSFESVGMAADGEIVVGIANAVYTWDASNGRLLGPPITRGAGLFTATAFSPDGNRLAFGYDDNASVDRSIHPSRTGSVIVWDLIEHKEKWRSPGIMVTGRSSSTPYRVTSLAFAPGGDRVAVQSAGKLDRILLLDPNASLPKITLVRSHPLRSELAIPPVLFWSQDAGKIFWNAGDRFVPYDPTTFEPGDVFSLINRGAQQREPNKTAEDRGRAIVRPSTPKKDLDEPPGDYETKTTMSADGTTMAIFFLIDYAPPKVALFDVASRRRIGEIVFTDPNMAPLYPKRRATPDFEGTNDRHSLAMIALSGNGKWLAVSDHVGTTRIYGLSNAEKPPDHGGLEPGLNGPARTPIDDSLEASLDSVAKKKTPAGSGAALQASRSFQSGSLWSDDRRSLRFFLLDRKPAQFTARVQFGETGVREVSGILSHKHRPDQWTLFWDSSKDRLIKGEPSKDIYSGILQEDRISLEISRAGVSLGTLVLRLETSAGEAGIDSILTTDRSAMRRRGLAKSTAKGLRLEGEAETAMRRPLGASLRNFSESTWDMIRIRGVTIEPIYKVTLTKEGKISGASHPNETRWQVRGNNLVFLNQNGAVTTTFTDILFKDGHMELRGRFATGQFLHGLVETSK
jgi:WD40 repeat protein